MRLADAIRLSGMQFEQGFINDPHDGTTAGLLKTINGDRVCALVGACRVVGDFSGSWSAPWPWINEGASVTCPQCGSSHLNLMIAIIHLNDHHRLNRDQIADFVEPFEIAHEVESRRADAASVGTQDDSVPTAVSVEKEKTFCARARSGR